MRLRERPLLTAPGAVKRASVEFETGGHRGVCGAEAFDGQPVDCDEDDVRRRQHARGASALRVAQRAAAEDRSWAELSRSLVRVDLDGALADDEQAETGLAGLDDDLTRGDVDLRTLRRQFLGDLVHHMPG